MALARTKTSKAVSVPSRAIRPDRRIAPPANAYFISGRGRGDAIFTGTLSRPRGGLGDFRGTEGEGLEAHRTRNPPRGNVALGEEDAIVPPIAPPLEGHERRSRRRTNRHRRA